MNTVQVKQLGTTLFPLSCQSVSTGQPLGGQNCNRLFNRVSVLSVPLKLSEILTKEKRRLPNNHLYNTDKSMMIRKKPTVP